MIQNHLNTTLSPLQNSTPSIFSQKAPGSIKQFFPPVLRVVLLEKLGMEAKKIGMYWGKARQIHHGIQCFRSKLGCAFICISVSTQKLRQHLPKRLAFQVFPVSMAAFPVFSKAYLVPPWHLQRDAAQRDRASVPVLSNESKLVDVVEKVDQSPSF